MFDDILIFIQLHDQEIQIVNIDYVAIALALIHIHLCQI